MKRLTLALIFPMVACLLASGLYAQRATGTVSGMVTADHGEVRAFRVKATDTVHRISYTVFTRNARYVFHALPASRYQITVVEEGYETPVVPVEVGAGSSTMANLSARWTSPVPSREAVEFDVLYPPAPARDTLIRACFGCHGVGSRGGKDGGLHAHGGKDERGWRAAVSRMFQPGAIGYGNWGDSQHMAYIPDDVVSATEREAVVRYLATNFGPAAKPRTLKLDPLVRDEAALAEALFVQYELPPNHGIHDVFPSRAMPGWVWTSMTPGAIVGTDTRNPDPATRTKDFPIPDAVGKVASHGIIEEKGLVYWTEIAGNHIGELDPRTGVIRRYRVPSNGGWQHTLRADTKGNIWVSYMSGANKIAKLDAVTKQVTEFPAVKAANSYGMVVDRRDRVILSVVSNKAVPVYDSGTGRWSVYETPNSTRRPTVDSKGTIWAAQYFGNAVSKIDPDTGTVTNHTLPLRYGDPYDVVADPQDSLWIENTMYNSLVRFDPRSRAFSYVPFPVLNGHTPKLESDDEGTIWFGLSSVLTSLKMHGNRPSRGNGGVP